MKGILLLLILAAQEPPGQEAPRRIEFQFRDAPADAVFQFITRETGLVVVNRANFHGTISAHGATEADIDSIVAFLDTALRAANHAAVRRGEFIVVLTVEQARTETPDIVVARESEDVPVDERIRTFLIPLRNLNAVDAEKELKALFPQGAQVAVNRHSNAIVITDAGINVQRIVRILKLLDVQVNENLTMRVFPLQNADAQQMVELINQIFLVRREEEDPTGGWGRIIRLFAGRGNEEEGPRGRASPAGAVVRVAADLRTNSVIVGSTPENIDLIGQLIEQLDRETPEAMRIAVHPLRYADATQAAQLINEVFRQPARPDADGTGSRPGGRMRWSWWWGTIPGQEETVSSSIGVRAVADVRTNCVIVTAGERQLALVEELIAEIDRQVGEIVRLKIYTLRHADAAEMARIIRETLRPAPTGATGTAAATNRTAPRWAQALFGVSQQPQSPATPLAPVEVTTDPRTNSVIVKASEEYIAVIDRLVEELDSQPGAEIQTFVVPVRDRRADEVADLLRALAGQGPSRRSQEERQRAANRAGVQNFGSFFHNQNNQRRMGGTNPFGGFFGVQPMSPPQDAEAPPPQEPQEPPQEVPAGAGLTGTIEVEPDFETNSLVIRTSARNFQEIQRLLAELDRPVPQVLVRVLIADVTLDEAMSLGVEATWRTESPLGDLELSTDFEALNQSNVGQGAFLFSVTGDHVEARLTALAREGRANILATPRILVVNNARARVQVGSQVPLVTSSRIDQNTGDTINTIQYTDVGIILDVRPTINPSGLVTLEISPTVSDLDPTRQVPISSTASAPTITQNLASTTVTVRHGQTVIIGGLIREQEEHVRQKVPLLGDLPLVGFLFGKRDDVARRRELMMFVTPYIVHTQPQLDELTALERARLKLLDERDIEEEVGRWHRFLRD